MAMTLRNPPHVLLLLRGFRSDGPGWQVADTLRALRPEEIRVSLVALEKAGPLRPLLEAEVKRLGGRLATTSGSLLGARRIVHFIRARPWFGDITHLCCHLFRADMIGRRLARQSGLPCLVVEHGLHSWSDKSPLLRPAFKVLYHLTLHDGVWIGAVSEKVRRQLLRENIAPERILLLPNGVDLGRFPLPTDEERRGARESFGFGEEDVVLLGAGLLKPGKRWEVAVRALEPLPAHYRLLLAGEGPARGTLTHIAREEGVLEQLEMAGEVGDIERAYAAADILLHPSRQESFGRVVIEALSRGVGVIVRAGSGADQILPPWPLALAVEGESPTAWAAAVQELQEEQSAQPALRRERHEYAAQNHSARRTAEALLAALRRMDG